MCVCVCICSCPPFRLVLAGTVHQTNSVFEFGGKNGNRGRIPVHGRKRKAGDVCLRWGGQLRVNVHPFLDTGVHVGLHLLTRVTRFLLLWTFARVTRNATSGDGAEQRSVSRRAILPRVDVGGYVVARHFAGLG